MAQTPEAKVKAAVRKLLDTHGAYYFSPVTGGFGKSGVPDIIACFHGQFIGIECKAGDNQPTALQLRELANIREHEGIAVVVNEKTTESLDQLLQLVRDKRNGR